MSTAFPARPELNTQPKSQAGLQAGTTCPHEVHSSQDPPKADFHFAENYRNVGLFLHRSSCYQYFAQSHLCAAACANKLLILEAYNYIN